MKNSHLNLRIENICTKARKSHGCLAGIPMLSPANYVTI